MSTGLLRALLESNQQASDRIFAHEPLDVAVGAPEVIDVRGLKGFAVILNGGTANWQPCDAAGVVIPGSAPTAAESGTVVENPWAFVLITAAVAACTVSLI